MSTGLPEAAGKIADAIAEFYGADRDQLGVALAGNGITIIGSETMEPYNWATEWPSFLSHKRLLADLKAEVSTTLDGNMAVQVCPTQPKPVKWTSSRFGTLRGEVGGLELFTIAGATDRSGDYLLHTRLPVYVGEPFSTEGDAKAGAERLLAQFIERVTA